MPSVADFSRSTATWLLQTDDSYGRWALEATCSFRPKRRGPGNREYSVLSSGVAACSVYAESNLIHNPPYFYRIIFSNQDYWIERTPEPGLPLRDSHGKISELFKSVDVSVQPVRAKRLKTVDSIIEAARTGRRLNAQVFIRSSSGRLILEFPVKHINMHASLRHFQVETGPVLWRVEDGRPRTAYVAFNSLDRLELIFESSNNRVPGREYRFLSEIAELKAQICMYACDEQ